MMLQRLKAIASDNASGLACVLLFFIGLSVAHLLWAPVFIALLFVGLSVFWKRLQKTKLGFESALIDCLK